MQLEKKQWNGVFLPANSTWSANTWTALDQSVFDGISQGNDNNNRLGKNINAQKLFIYGCFKYDVAATPTPAGAMIRFLVVHDRQANGANMPVDVVNDPQAVADGAAGFMNFPYNAVTRGRYRVLVDRRIAVLQGAAGPCCFEFDIPLKGLKIQYDANAGSITDLTKNNIGIYLVADHASSAGNFTELDFQYRVQFTDA